MLTTEMKKMKIKLHVQVDYYMNAVNLMLVYRQNTLWSISIRPYVGGRATFEDGAKESETCTVPLKQHSQQA